MKTIQKTLLRIFVIAGVAVSFVGMAACHPHKNDPVTPDKKDTVQPVDTFPKHDRPTWVVADTTDLESTMTITGSLPASLRTTVDTADLVAAFSGSACWGVTSVQYVNDIPYFFLYINRPRTATHTSSVLLTLRYYSAKTHYILVEKDAFEFVVDGYLGTVEAPVTPAFATHE